MSNVATIAASIAAVSVSGLAIKGLDGIIEGWDGRVPIMFPRPDGYVSDMTVNRETFGLAPGAMRTMRYNLHYTFMHSLIGTNRIDFDRYPDMVSMAALILSTFTDVDLGGAELNEVTASNFGVVTDPIGKAAHGCEIVFQITEYANG